MLHIHSDKALPPIPVLQKTGWSLDLSVTGASMEPLIQSGDTVTVRCTPPEAMKEGDIICFQVDEGFVLHRLLEVSGTGDKCFYEKGDAETRGNWIPAESVLGVLAAVNHKPPDHEMQAELLTFSRRERAASELLNHMHLSPGRSVLSAFWRKVKTACRRKRTRGAR